MKKMKNKDKRRSTTIHLAKNYVFLYKSNEIQMFAPISRKTKQCAKMKPLYCHHEAKKTNLRIGNHKIY
jgi:hypothetical protein